MKNSLCDDFLNPGKIVHALLPGLGGGASETASRSPWAVEIHPTAKCNHQCIHCSYRERNESRNQLDPAVMSNLIASLIKMGVKGVYFSGGGEPVLYPKLAAQVKTLTDSGVAVAVLSNGSGIDESGLLEVADRLGYLAISVPSCRPDLFQHITGRQHLEKILSLPVKIRARHGGRAPVIGARVVITTLISAEVSRMLFILRSQGFDYVIFKVVRDYEDRGLGLSEVDVAVLRRQIEELENSGEIDPRFTNLNKIFDYRAPYEPAERCWVNEAGLLAAVTPEAEVYPNIAEIGRPDFLIGNLKENNFEDLWNSPRHSAVKLASNQLWQQGRCRNCRAIAYNGVIKDILSMATKEADPFI